MMMEMKDQEMNGMTTQHTISISIKQKLLLKQYPQFSLSKWVQTQLTEGEMKKDV